MGWQATEAVKRPFALQQPWRAACLAASMTRRLQQTAARACLWGCVKSLVKSLWCTLKRTTDAHVSLTTTDHHHGSVIRRRRGPGRRLAHVHRCVRQPNNASNRQA